MAITLTGISGERRNRGEITKTEEQRNREETIEGMIGSEIKEGDMLSRGSYMQVAATLYY